MGEGPTVDRQGSTATGLIFTTPQRRLLPLGEATRSEKREFDADFRRAQAQDP
ncbi:MAG: hypothetical protein QOE93_2031, partial [Actinomycetota bacterium]|nr:hypothetical protein [Actinomycetota bacterium]